MKEVKNILKKIISYLYPKKNGLNIIRVLTGPAKGTKMMLNIREGGSYLLGNYDKWIFDRIALKNILKPGMVAWDCGAFYGYYGAIFRKLVDETGRVEIFEASKNYTVVSTLPDLNNWNNVSVHHLAIGPDHSIIKFAVNLGGSSGPFGLSKKYSQTESEIELETVNCCGVDELIAEKGIAVPDLIKFDLESAEVFALHNGAKLFTTKRPIVLLELHGQEAMEAAGEFLEKYDYKAMNIFEMNLESKRIFTSKQSLLDLGGIPHMLYCYF